MAGKARFKMALETDQDLAKIAIFGSTVLIVRH